MDSLAIKFIIVLAIIPILETKHRLQSNSNCKKNTKSCEHELGETFETCGSACPDTCDNYSETRICTLQCVIGCSCPRGTVRRESDRHCVKPEDC